MKIFGFFIIWQLGRGGYGQNTPTGCGNNSYTRQTQLWEIKISTFSSKIVLFPEILQNTSLELLSACPQGLFEIIQNRLDPPMYTKILIFQCKISHFKPFGQWECIDNIYIYIFFFLEKLLWGFVDFEWQWYSLDKFESWRRSWENHQICKRKNGKIT